MQAFDKCYLLHSPEIKNAYNLGLIKHVFSIIKISSLISKHFSKMIHNYRFTNNN